MPAASRVRSVCFTLNNPSDDEIVRIYLLLQDSAHTKYAVVGNERGESGTPHLQGYWSLAKQTSFDKVRRLLPRAHIERAKGSPTDNRNYCSKDGDFEEFGEFPTDRETGGERPLLQFARALESGRKLCEVAKEDPQTFIKYGAGIARWIDVAGISKKRTCKTYVTVYVGPPGTGKSRRAHEEASAIGDVYYWSKSKEWFLGYKQEACVIVDDFYGQLPFARLLNLLDRYPFQVEHKGGHQEFNSSHIWFTSNAMPHAWYKDERLDIDALARRIDKLVFMDYGNERPVTIGDGRVTGACATCMERNKCSCPWLYGDAVIMRNAMLT